MNVAAGQFQDRINRITSKYALYFSLEDDNRHTDAPSFLSLITDFSLVAFAQEVLPILGHHLIERAGDFVLDRTAQTAGRTFKKLAAWFRGTAGRDSSPADEVNISAETTEVVRQLLEALRAAQGDERNKALAAGAAAIAELTKTQFGMPADKAREFAVAVTTEVRVTVSGP